MRLLTPQLAPSLFAVSAHTAFHLSSAIPALICHHLFFFPFSFKAAVHPVEYSWLSSCMDDLILTPLLLCAGNGGAGGWFAGEPVISGFN